MAALMCSSATIGDIEPLVTDWPQRPHIGRRRRVPEILQVYDGGHALRLLDELGERRLSCRIERGI